MDSPPSDEGAKLPTIRESLLPHVDELKKELAGPNLIDEDLTKQLIERGAQDFPSFTRQKTMWILAFVIPTIFLSAFFGFSYFGTLFSILFIGWASATVMAHQVSSAMKNRHYAKVVKLLPRTLYWTTMWYPYSFNAHLSATDSFVRLLMLEGRFVEFQAVTLYSWGLIEPNAARRQKNPRNWGVANNLAVALLSQWKFEEAGEVFKELLNKPCDKRAEAIILNNLALCQIHCGQIDEADKTLAEALKKATPSVRQYIGWRLDYIKALIETERGNLKEAESCLETAVASAIRNRDNLECQPRCDALMGRIRALQDRLEEAELYYKNALEAMAGVNNPFYLALAAYTLEFAVLLELQGKTEESKVQREKAHAYRDLNLLNEMKTVDAIKERINNNKPIIVPTGLCNLSVREIYLESVPEFAIPDQDELEKLLGAELPQITEENKENSQDV